MSEMSDEATDEVLLWEQLPEETGRAYKAFCAYRDAGLTRTLVGVYRQETGRKQAGQPSGEWTGWLERHRWRERAKAWDAHLDALARQTAEAEHVKKLKAYRERAGKLGETGAKVSLGLLIAVGQRLTAMTAAKPDSGEETVADIPLGSLPSFLRTAAAVGQASLAMEAQSLGVQELEGLLDDQDAAEDPG